ncbi:MBL fold metallo-hydrolase [Tessaracoccus sp. SD287]|uniref:MBL fold metallo-hydrolase n=1 Tax=Tessaracoccus sp. SD287 TaxID=2782008 RepID=UPI001A96422F|nr:MBL fold metallo-hydrolase [Tessaracoccus sp. SD287]MBO1032027.1 MBL fold metallo-hydrolase [Tessaracoccus sp. SD287]
MTTYHVDPHADPLSFDLGGGVFCTKQSLGDMDNNGYLLEPADGPAVWIDAAAEPEVISKVLDGRALAAVITTHRHFDHIGATAAVLAATGAVGYCGEPDRQSIIDDTATEQVGVWTGDTINVGTAGRLEVIGIVGHTPGSITLAWSPADGPTHLFTGDSLFPGGFGKTWSAEDFASLSADVTVKIFERFGDDTVVHPGHGDATTLGVERPHLAEWRDRGW